jgi:hypothetical protein
MREQPLKGRGQHSDSATTTSASVDSDVVSMAP